MTMPLADSPRSAMWWATPSAQRRTLSNVNSSAIRARQPSVPNTIVVGAGGPLVMGRAASRFGTAVQHPPNGRDVRSRASQQGEGLGGGHATPLQRLDDAEPAADPADHEVIGLALDGLARLDDATGPRGPDRAKERGPRPEVGPARVHRRHD